jgi:hypothetical protein
MVSASFSIRDLLTGGQFADIDNGFLKLPNGSGLETDGEDGCPSAPDPDQGAAVANFLKRRESIGKRGGVSGDGVGDTRAEVDG